MPICLRLLQETTRKVFSTSRIIDLLIIWFQWGRKWVWGIQIFFSNLSYLAACWPISWPLFYHLPVFLIPILQILSYLSYLISCCKYLPPPWLSFFFLIMNESYNSAWRLYRDISVKEIEAFKYWIEQFMIVFDQGIINTHILANSSYS